VLGCLDNSNLSSDDEWVVVAVHGELALVDGVVVVSDDLVPDWVGGVNEVNVDDVEDLVEGLAALERVEAVLGADRVGVTVLGLEDLQESLDVVDLNEEELAWSSLVLSGESSELSEELDDSLLVEGEDLSSLVVESLSDEDLSDDVLGSVVDSTGISVDVLVSDRSWNSDVLSSDDVSVSVDNSVLLDGQK